MVPHQAPRPLFCRRGGELPMVGICELVVEEDGMSEQTCACVSEDAYQCWRIRYALPRDVDVETSGGPCDCPCHDWPEERDDER